ncbi:hypothetical protein LAZ67_2003392, partial [Cordylochernes scorpioides]
MRLGVSAHQGKTGAALKHSRSHSCRQFCPGQQAPRPKSTGTEAIPLKNLPLQLGGGNPLNPRWTSPVLSPHCSVFQAEAHGLVKALENATTLPDPLTLGFFLDNLSVVKSVLNSKTGGNPLNPRWTSPVLSPHCSVFQAEAHGLVKALENATTLPDPLTLGFFLDNLSVVKSVLNSKT